MIYERACAKINLSLDVTGKRADGYHYVDMLMQETGLHDDIYIMPCGGDAIKLDIIYDDSHNLLKKEPDISKSEDIINNRTTYGRSTCSHADSQMQAGTSPPANADLRADDDPLRNINENLMYRAALLMKESFCIKSGISMRLIKRIPVQAGLGGGSSDAAAVIRGINRLFRLGTDTPELERLGARLGSDVPFFISGGLQRATDTGIRLEKISGFRTADAAGDICSDMKERGFPVYVLIAKPYDAGSTPRIYAAYDQACSRCDIIHPDTAAQAAALGAILNGHKNADNLQSFYKNTLNVLEYAVDYRDKVLGIKGRMAESGAEASSMTGSGSAVFGLYTDAGRMHNAALSLMDDAGLWGLTDITETRLYFRAV